MRSLPSLTSCVILAGLFSAFADSATANPGIYERVLRSTVWIENKHNDCQGSGVLVDLDNRLVVSNAHVVCSAEDVLVYFSAYDEQGELITDRRIYGEHFSDLRAAGIAMVGRVIVRSEKKDLALIQLEQLPSEPQAIPLAARSCGPAESVHSVGNSAAGIDLWTYTTGTVRQKVSPAQLQLDSGGRIDAVMLVTDSPINKGDSGGPMVNDNGELVGIVSSFKNDARLVSRAIDIRELHGLLQWYSGTAAEERFLGGVSDADIPGAIAVGRIAQSDDEDW